MRWDAASYGQGTGRRLSMKCRGSNILSRDVVARKSPFGSKPPDGSSMSTCQGTALRPLPPVVAMGAEPLSKSVEPLCQLPSSLHGVQNRKSGSDLSVSVEEATSPLEVLLLRACSNP